MFFFFELILCHVVVFAGQWKLSDSGLEWVVLEETEEERIEKELQHDSDSDLDVEVMPNPSQDEEENFTKGQYERK